MPGEKVALKLQWVTEAEHAFNTICIGSIVRTVERKPAGLCLVTACLDGVVRIYEIPKCGGKEKQQLKLQTSLETKGGPLQALVLHDVTRFYSNDVVVADSRGLITVFCNEQILTRRVVTEECILCLQVEQDLLGNIAMVVSDSNGHITALSPYSDLWSIRLTDIPRLRGLGMSPFVTSLLAVRLTDQEGVLRDYILATDNCRHLFVIHQGSVVSVLNTPAPINAMCSGYFLDSTSLEASPNSASTRSSKQVALGSETGAIYIMSDLEIFHEEFANIQSPIKVLSSLPAPEPGRKDALLCAGNFTGLCVLAEGKTIAWYETPTWVNSVVTADIDSDNQTEVVIGCHDNSIHAVKVHIT